MFLRLDGAFVPWSVSLRQRLLEVFPLPEDLEPIPDNVLLEPKWVLTPLDEGSVSAPAQPGSSSNPERIASTTLDASESAAATPPEDLLPVNGSIEATLLENTRITPQSHWQDVRHLTFSAPTPLQYGPGDVLKIYPKNFPSDVTQFLEVMGWTAVADTPLRFSQTSAPTSSSNYPLPPIPDLPADHVLTLRSLLTNHLDIMSIPRRSFFSQLAHYSSDPFQRDRLIEFTDPQYIDELYDYTTRPRRSILEVLQEFDSVKIPWERVTSVLPVMRGRQFSIASGGALKSAPQDATRTRIELLVAIVKYRTVIKRIRQGVATRYIASLRPSQKLSVTLQRGSLRMKEDNLKKPIVMVGPGTGVAPMRSMIYERLALRRADASDPAGPLLTGDMLFFGCRNEHADYFFKDEWALLEKEVALTTWTAFSRDQVRCGLAVFLFFL